MSIPENTKPFDLSMAQAKHPIITRDGRKAKFIAYVPENDEYYQTIVCVDGKPEPTNNAGSYGPGASEYDLFLSPLGYCEGLPVWPGDKLNDEDGNTFVINVKHCNFKELKWPIKAPVVETRMTETEAYKCFVDISLSSGAKGILAVANKAIERSIADGDCIPSDCFVQMASDAFNKHYNSAVSFQCVAESVLNDYLEGLKK